MTVLVIEIDGKITYAAPIIKRFTGQPISNLERWMSSLGNFRKAELLPSKPKKEQKMSDQDSVELYRRYRPKTFKDVIGQEEAIDSVISMGKEKKIPHAILFTGPSGCGKTTIARILREKLKCSDIDFNEINAADDKGIDMIREIKSRMGMSTLGGETRVFLIDEAHQMTTQAQDCFLKYLEDTPKHVYFFICTTDPRKLKKTIITRCTEIRCKEISKTDLKNLAIDVAEKEGGSLDNAVAERLAIVADGSARKALVLLHAILALPTVEKQIATIDANDTERQAKDICQALFRQGTTWKEMATILLSVEDDAESLRYSILGYCRAVLLRSGSKRARDIMEHFRDNFYDTKAAGLAIACYDAIE